MPDFLLEIGTEELPARFLANEEAQILELFDSALHEEKLPFDKMEVYSTPRRLALVIVGLAERQKSGEEIIIGPPLNIAYDATGKPSQALLGFLKNNQADESQVFNQKSGKGEYIAIKKQIGGKSAKEILQNICPQILSRLSFPKRMHWAHERQPYARPVHWILALLDKEPVKFDFAGISSDIFTYGHRVHGTGKQAAQSIGNWVDILEQSGIVVDSQKRKNAIIEAGNKLANEIDGQVVWKDSLLDEVSGLVEYPVVILGSFDPAYLEIPSEVLLTSMETHQKSFGLRDQQGNLLPAFLTVLNLKPKNMEIVRKGWERVLKARLEDAQFFWRNDSNIPFSHWQEKLKDVIFIGQLGTMAEKTDRLEKLCAWLASKFVPSREKDLERAAQLAKADLVSGMVGEFDVLQGIMGGIYAKNAGENEIVYTAISEQYLPAGPDTPVPASPGGAILSLADNADRLTGCFGLNIIPGGTADPQGLRRSALAIIRILLDKNWHLSLDKLFSFSRSLYGARNWKLSPEEAQEKLLNFMKMRLQNYFVSKGFPTTFVQAVLTGNSDDVTACKDRLEALTRFAKSDNFVELAQILKRSGNIVKKSSSALDDAKWQKEYLLEEEEKNLADILTSLEAEVQLCLANKDYDGAFNSLNTLQEPVSKFFDKIMVNCEDRRLKENRLKLLRDIEKIYAPLLSFNLLQV